jgi:hypothetical protein
LAGIRQDLSKTAMNHKSSCDKSTIFADTRIADTCFSLFDTGNPPLEIEHDKF